MKIVSSNKATLKIPILPFGVNPSPEDGTTARPPTPSAPLGPSSTTRGGSSSGSDNEYNDDGSRRENEEREGEGDGGEESNNAGAKVSAAKVFRSDGTASAAAVPQVWSEGRTTWEGDTLTALRTPLFVVEVAVVGEKGGEVFAYTQRLSAVKESALALIDKAIASTQVNRSWCRRWRRRCWWWKGFGVDLAAPALVHTTVVSSVICWLIYSA